MASDDSEAYVSSQQRLLSPSDVRVLADQLGVRPSKKLGQNFVIDPNTLRRIVRLAGVTEPDVVLEVGPGLGSLTLALVGAASRVTAIEVDSQLAAALPGTLAAQAPAFASRCTVIEADALRVSQLPDPQPNLLVANLPYNVSVPVLLHLLQLLPSLHRALVLVQAEVAERLAAGPGSKTYGVPSAKAAWYGQVQLAGGVPRSVFWPVPNVDSGLVSLVRRDPPPTAAGREQVFQVIDAAFAQRRKTLRAALRGPSRDPKLLDDAFAAAGIDPQARGEQLGIAEFGVLTEALTTSGAW